MKQRKLAKQSPIRKTTICWSTANNRANLFESELEFDFFIYLEFEHRDCVFMSQPYSVEYKIDGKKRRYTPDFLLEHDGQITLIEIKHSKQTESEVFQHKTKVLEDFFAAEGKSFVVITEDDIRIGHRAQNLRFLRPVLNLPEPSVQWGKVLTKLPTFHGSVITLQDTLCKLGFDPSIARQAIAHRILDCDLTQKWDALMLSW